MMELRCLQTVIARETDPLHSQVVSLTRVDTGGNAYNVIPDVVKLGATYRSLTHGGMVRMKERMAEVSSARICPNLHKHSTPYQSHTVALLMSNCLSVLVLRTTSV